MNLNTLASKFASRRLFLLLWKALTVLLIGAAAAQAQEIPAGEDCWMTEPEESSFDFPSARLPAGFFGQKGGIDSDEIGMFQYSIDLQGEPSVPCNCEDIPMMWVRPHGNPNEPNFRHKVSVVPPDLSDVDTCVRRNEDATFPGGVGDPVPIEIEILALSLKSVNPIAVSYGAQPDSFFDVLVTLEPSAQNTGQLDFTPTSLSGSLQGNLTLQSLPVLFRIDFVEVDSTATPAPLPLRDMFFEFSNADGEDGVFGPIRIPESCFDIFEDLSDPTLSCADAIYRVFGADGENNLESWEGAFASAFTATYFGYDIFADDPIPPQL